MPGAAAPATGDSLTPAAAAGDPGAHRAERDGARDADSAIPDLEHVPRILARTEVQFIIRDHVVKAGTDQAEWHCPGGDIQNQPRAAADRPVTALGHPDGHDHPSDDAQRVGAYGDGSQMPHALGRAGDECDGHSLGRYPLSPADGASSGLAGVFHSSRGCRGHPAGKVGGEASHGGHASVRVRARRAGTARTRSRR